MSDLFADDWRTRPMLAVDTETTGPDPQLDRVVTATTVLVNGAVTTVKTWLADPGIPISPGAAAIHGVTNDVAQSEGRPAAEVLAAMATVIDGAITNSTPLVLFNAKFDLTLLAREFTRHGIDLDLSRALVIDGYVIDKGVDKYRKGKRTLTVTCEHYGVRHDGAHDATEDALAAARVAWAIAARFPEQVCVALEVLHAKQAAWHLDWAESYGRYRVRSGGVDDVSREWPIQTAPPNWTAQQMPAAELEAAS